MLCLILCCMCKPRRNCRILLARLEYLRETFQIKEGDFLTFDALVVLATQYFKSKPVPVFS